MTKNEKEINKERKYYAKVAKDLCYSEHTINKIMKAKSVREMEMAMITARQALCRIYD